MSIYATQLTIEHPEQWMADLQAQGVIAGVIGDDSEERELGSPYIYQGSNVLPSLKDERGGSVMVSMIPNHITRDGRDDGKAGLHDWIRLDVDEDPKTYGTRQMGKATVVLDRAQAEAIYACLGAWLHRSPDVEEWTDEQIEAFVNEFRKEDGE